MHFCRVLELEPPKQGRTQRYRDSLGLWASAVASRIFSSGGSVRNGLQRLTPDKINQESQVAKNDRPLHAPKQLILDTPLAFQEAILVVVGWRVRALFQEVTACPSNF